MPEKLVGTEEGIYVMQWPARIIYNTAQIERIRAKLEEARPEFVRAMEDAEGPGLFPFAAEISSERLDSYFTHMTVRTLTNFVADAREGVAFQDSHSRTRLGFGMSIDGMLEVVEEGITRAVADFYTVPGITFGGMHSYQSTDDFIRAVEAGLVRDVSVGFYGGRWICDISGLDYFDWNCPYIAGLEYELTDPASGETETVVSTVSIDNARLSEVSAVFDGSTPGAMLLKAERAARAGELDDMQRLTLQERFRRELPESQKVFAGSDLKLERTSNGADLIVESAPGTAVSFDSNKGVTTMKEKDAEKTDQDEGVRITVENTAALSGIFQEAGIEHGDSLVDSVRALAEAADGFRARAETAEAQVTAANDAQAEAETRIAELSSLADDGRAYRVDLVEQAISEGIRALGEGFPEESYRTMLEGESVELATIRQIRDSFAETARAAIPSGQIIETAADDKGSEDEEVEESATPMQAYIS